VRGGARVLKNVEARGEHAMPRRWGSTAPHLSSDPQKARDTGQGVGRPVGIGVGAGNAQGRLAGVTKALGNAGQEQRPAGDRLEMPSGLREPDEQVPPVLDQGDQTGRKPATSETLCREPSPAPLVLHRAPSLR